MSYYNVGGQVHYDQSRRSDIQYRTNMTQRDEVQKFEHGRIKVLQEERLHIQKKTFTKWMNSFLQKVRMEVEDLFVDLADGRKLLKLLEIISGEKLAKPNNGKMRVHKIENVNKSLAFLHTKVRLESIGAEDIVDGNPRLILGLIWTIILRFQIQEIEIDVDEENESSEKKSAKDALLLWAQRKTHGYPGVQINDFTGSWRSGLGFNALIHAHRPDLFDFNQLQPLRHIDNLNHAFDVANNELGIPSLLDAEDIDMNRPDEKSIMTYVASYYHTFARMKNEAKSGRRIEKIIGQMMQADKMKTRYDKLTTDLLEWIQKTVVALEERPFPNSLEGIQQLLINFGMYRTLEKPPKYIERSEIEALFFNINTQMKELRQPIFTPADGKLLQDIERAWDQLEKAEHRREVDLRAELRRQEKLELINYKFEKKSILRENYLKEMIQVLSDPRYGSNLTQVDATVKKHEAISADILAREERVLNLTQMCQELVKEKYRNSERVIAREEEVLTKWKELLALLNKHKFNLNRIGNVMSLLREIDTALANVNQLKMDVSSVDTGVHLLAVEELLQKHALQELQITSLGETERRLKRSVEQIIAQNPKEQDIIKTKFDELANSFKELQNMSKNRRALLEEARNFYQFLQDQEDEEAWLIEKQRICQAPITAKDLRGILSLQQKHKLLLDEIKTRKNKFDQLGHTGRLLINEKHPRAKEIQHCIDTNQQEWSTLEKLANERTKRLQDAAETYQFYADANEADSFLHEKKYILESQDYGSDEPSAQALLQRHRDLQGELNAYNGDIQSLNNQAERLISAGISNLEEEIPTEELFENKMIPIEVYEDEPVEKIEYRTVYEEQKVRQVKARYPYHDDRMSMAKGEVMFLLSENNPDWWCVRKADGTDGFAPANYLEEIQPRIIQKKVNKPEKVRTIEKVKKTKMVMQKVPVSGNKGQRVTKKTDDSNSVPKRRKNINDTYDECQEMSAKRHALLEDAIRLYRFYRECDDFEKWIKDKEKMLASDDPNQKVEQAINKHKKFVTDLSASKKRLEGIDAEVKEFEKQNHSQIDKVRARHRQITAAWDRLRKLGIQKEKSLEGASIVEIFLSTCGEAKDRMHDKLNNLDEAVLAHDLKTVQALQRRHEQLEREITPIEKTVNEIADLANSVISSNPHERANVSKTEDEIKDLWMQVKDKAQKRRAGLENAVGHQIFSNGANTLLAWVADVKNQLNADNTVRDVQTAENLLKNHQDLKHDIDAHRDEFTQVGDLGKKLLKSNSKLTDIPEKLTRLAEEQAALDRGWKEKQDWLQQCLQLQKFNKEADKIDAATSSHQAFLEYSELGNSLDEVEALLKQHREFANTLVAQDTALNTFDKQADNLIKANHYDSQGIDDRRKQVLQKRQAVKDLSQARSHALEASKNYQEFCAQVDDLRAWLAEKKKTASDESYRDLSNLERKLQKHEAFERELRANEGQLRTVNKLGQSLIAQNSYRKDDVAKTLKDLNDEWQSLVGTSLDKGRRLRQAETQHTYNTAVDSINNKLGEIEKKLNSPDVGNDLRSCKELLKKHEMLENELAQCSSRVDELANQSNEMTDDDHFDSAAVKEEAAVSKDRLKDLATPAKKRRDALEESLCFHKFRFDLDNELQWIKEHMPQASSENLGQNLHQTQNMYKKHKNLEDEILGHQPVIDKTLENGQGLIAQKHPEARTVQELCQSLTDAWNDLQSKAAERAQKLELSLKAQQYFFDASEVESWLNERKDVLASTDYGRDRDAATKLLTKHKALELELDTYSSIIAEMGRGAQAHVQSGHPESKAISERQAGLEHLVRSLQRRAAVRQQCLMESLFRHEYFLESEDLERWIAEQHQHAASEDYGQDYEHLQLLQAKFDDFKHRIEAGSERFKQCEDLAQKLITNKNPYIGEIGRKQQLLETKWANLRDQIENRERRLHAAGEIHRFHRDVSDALSRIQEKNASLGTDLGRDLNSALSLLRKQEAFENELVVLEAQLQVLIDDAPRLMSTYPKNKKQIQDQQDLIVSAWQGLRERTEMRKDQLQASVDLQKFLTQVRNLTNWSTEVRAAMDADDNLRSMARAQALKDEHDALKVEIEAREELFQAVADMSTAMEKTGHYAANEVVEKCAALFEERERLHQAWHLKKIKLDQLMDLHLFMREAKQLENISNAQEAALGNLDFGESIEEVARQVKKHEEFEKLLNAQDEKFDSLLVTGDKLLMQKHFESGQIAVRLAEIQAKRLKVRQMCLDKKKQLHHALLYAEFVRDVADARNWISEKEKVQAEIKTGEVSNLEDKIKKLQKHQAFQAEVAANLGRMEEIRLKGETLIKQKHKASSHVAKQLYDLDEAWNRLLEEVESCGKGLEEAQDILEFNNQLDKIDAWIRDKEVMVQAADTGRDYEHCQALQRKLDDVDSDMRVDDTRIRIINALADKLIKQDHQGVQERKNDFIRKWQNLQGALTDYRNKLSGASEVHLFNRDVADTNHRIAEKVAAMQDQDVGKDLPGVEVLQRKQEAAEVEMTAVEKKLKDHERDSYKLSQKYPHNAVHITNQMENLQKQWNTLLDAKDNRRRALDGAYTKQKFLADTKDLEVWCSEMIKRMESRHKPTNVLEAVAQLELHDELKVEIDGRAEEFKKLINFGKEMGNSDNQINEVVEKLEQLQKNLLKTWTMHKQDLTHEYQLQGFKGHADQLDSWLASKEAFLNNDDVGENIRTVEALIRKHQDFEIMLPQQLVRITDLQDVATALYEDTRYDNNEVRSRMSAIISRKDNLIRLSNSRRKTLEESKALNEFVRNFHDVNSWLAEKIQVASDENYREPTNLQSKIQRHIAFEAEIVANRSRIKKVLNDGQELIDDGHFAAEEIANRLEGFEADAKLLQDLSQVKKDCLDDAYQALLFNRSLDEFEVWLSQIEQQLLSSDHGKDLATVNNLLKKHSSLEKEVQQHSKNCETINETAEDFAKRGHFMADELEDRAQKAITRYHQLQDPMQTRRDLLESSSMLHQFTRDVDDELQWLNDRLTMASSTDLGNTLTAVQSLQKKHLALEAELVSREPIVAGLVSRAAHLSASGHNAAPVINDKAAEVKSTLTKLRDMASIRKLRLQDALEAQTFYAEATEAEAWIGDKKPLLESGEIGRDEDSTQSLQRKLEGINCEIEAFRITITRLSKMSQELVDRQHYDSVNISRRRAEVDAKFKELENLLRERETCLAEALLFFGFTRECNEVQEWMSDQQTKAASEDYGTDVEHVELLTQAFETFLISLMNSKLRVQACIDNGNKLSMARSRHIGKVEQKVDEIKMLWEDLMELAQARKEALAGAKTVHMFDRTADETTTWIEEKENILNLDNYGHDLESIQALVRKHDAFETELLAVKEQVDYVNQEAKKLIDMYPDAEEHIRVKQEDTLAAWNDLEIQAEQRKEKLSQAEHLQSYYDQHQDLLAWINEMLAKITAPDLPQEATGAELLRERHKEHKVEIDAKSESFNHFFNTGNELIRNGHFLSHEIQGKLDLLEQRLELLHRIWYTRSIIYEQNLDVQLFKHDANTLENWMIVREATLRDPKVGDSIIQVEDMIRKHEDFENTIRAQEEKFAALKRMTLLEEAFTVQKQAELEARKAERERQEQERLAQRKKQEMQRFTEMRRAEEIKRGPEINGNYEKKKPDVAPPPPPTTNLTKSNSAAQMFGDRIRRGSDHSVKRAESMKVTAPPKLPKRTPSFTTRRRNSFKDKSPGHDFELPPVEIQTFLDRKQVLTAAGKRAQIRTWKNLYTVLCGQLLCFFKNVEDFSASKAMYPPLGIHNALCTVADDYNKRKHTFRLVMPDQSEYLFSCLSDQDMLDWVRKISFRAKLPPSQQLVHFEVQKQDYHDNELSSQSSRTSSPDVIDPVVMRDPTTISSNGNSVRHTIAGDHPPPPLPVSQPPNNGPRRHNTLDNSQDNHGYDEWSNTRGSRNSMAAGERKSSRLMDLFRKKRQPSTQF
ncbi:PREDICTED: spectrin alpha chain, non-erythrocytic 1 isoform X2 [Nicrophorus vespilloides]|uniref:Spectrin alpha chain, non-erythrocytic 1 isoform X2 n=1 Tax=Nicrophorus vespilloides TaxID=110193 RepID=A0ABM1N152_NICVS|nr:PREDICTED: spectrin alpha chain, non-erythrocytic 1 isoform X2 [Nicrophorus vespilloides]